MIEPTMALIMRWVSMGSERDGDERGVDVDERGVEDR
jgi:hypothetical protein